MTDGAPEEILDAALKHQAAMAVWWGKARMSDRTLVANAIAGARRQMMETRTACGAVQTLSHRAEAIRTERQAARPAAARGPADRGDGGTPRPPA